MQRMLKFDAILNARDFGGYEGRYGPLVAGKLLRTAHLSDATQPDLEKLRALDAGLIVDLRYLSERERQPNKWPENHRAQTLAFDATRTGQAPHEAFIERDLTCAADSEAYMVKNYAERPHNESFKKIFANTLKHMAQTGDGVLIHCAAGKDRTGTLVALIQAVLGVNHDDILSDYMLTMQSVDIDSILSVAAPRISKRFSRDISAQMLRPMFCVAPSYLQASLDSMGDGLGYALESLRLTQAQHKALIKNYVK